MKIDLTEARVQVKEIWNIFDTCFIEAFGLSILTRLQESLIFGKKTSATVEEGIKKLIMAEQYAKQ